ncbi:helix-turn-helix domain-containing protein [Filobacillus milosensis]|nr:helix-turn-helix transcriptional regulator [Filobacillus milosensis]
MSHIGERIKRVRKEKKLTLTQVAGNHMSAAMVSLIENGKTKPTVQTLQHIAGQLSVDTADLMGELNREDLRKVLKELKEQFEAQPSTIHKIIERLHETLPKLSTNYESARLYEWYARLLFWNYQEHRGENDFVKFDDWKEPALKAREIYEYLQMDTYVVKVEMFLIQVEYSQANYYETIKKIHALLNQMEGYENTRELISNKILLKQLLADSESGIGNLDRAYELIKEALSVAKKELIFDYFYWQHNTAVLLNYNVGRNDIAHKHLEEIEKFADLAENPILTLEKLLIEAHYQEFFENDPKRALNTCRQIREEFEKTTGYVNYMLEGFNKHIDEQEARCYTKLKQPEKALGLFREELRSIYIQDHPFDRSLREIMYSYRAYCYQQLGRTDEAVKEAEIAVEKLKTYPHTEYYQFAREVLRNIKALK